MDLITPTNSLARAWARDEFAALDCGDPRCKRRFLRVASDFVRNPSASVPAAWGDWAGTKACYNLFDRPEVCHAAILAARRAAVLGRLQASGCSGPLLVAQDTTSLNYGKHGSKEGLGPTGSQGKDKTPGLFVHGLLVLGTQGEVHGLAGASIHAREPRGAHEPAGKRNRQPLGEKESQRWVWGWQESQRLWEDLGGKREVIGIADREVDIYELLAACLQTRATRGGGAGLLVRSQHDRKLEGGSGTLWQTPAALPVETTLRVDLPRGKQGLAARTATLAVRAGRVKLEVPPGDPPSTGEAVRMIARLGGFLGRKGDGDPGPEVLWRGFAKLRTLAEAWAVFRTTTCG